MINVTGVAAYVSALYTIPRQLPFRAWYPIDWRHDERRYWIVYTYQVVGMIMQANLNICIEIFPGYLMYMARVKMEVLSLRLERNYSDVKTSPRESVTEFSFYSFFLVALVTQIFLPCFLGNEIIFTSSGLLNSAYNSSWEIMVGDYRKLLVIFMERLEQSSRIVVGKLFPLSLDTFTSIIYFAYRLYAVISNTK
ncbi:odorant receptor 94b-like [Bradysia coprophila]|uniref:odorant receptor 94b-like n=1 Tax=Bradysia coprophila TaxID=38358 RepID=UPI00187DB8BA|nr:odorant receptor 94b-like [Bradysia coprophila]